MMKTASSLVVFVALILLSRGIQSETSKRCSTARECTESWNVCCLGVCADRSKVCKIECLTSSDCNISRGEDCVNWFCDCVSTPCLLASEKEGRLDSCVDDADCNNGEKCRNRTCEQRAHGTSSSKEKPQGLPLNPALLAIVTIMGVLIFSCLFCCCLSKMKSERTSVKRREAKMKLKKDLRPSLSPQDHDITDKPLLKVETVDSSNSFNRKNETSTYVNKGSAEKERGSLAPVVVPGSTLSPIREEDEEVEKEDET